METTSIEVIGTVGGKHESVTVKPPMRKLRIVQLLNSLAVGGAERMALNLAIAQRQAGHEPILYCIESEGKLAQEARENGVEVRCFNKKPGKSPWTVVKIAQALKKDGADILHTHNPPAHYYGAPAAWLASIPAVCSRHSPVSSRGGEHKERYFRWMLRLTKRIVFISSDVQSQIEPQWAGRKVPSSIIRNGVPVERFSMERAPIDRNRPFVFGAIGRMAPVKCYDQMIDAFGAVSQKAPGCELHIVGDGPQSDALKAHVLETGTQDRVFIKPARLDVKEVLRAFDVFVVSSSSEGVPMVVLEAMSSGLPIVSTRVGGVPEVVVEGKFGWFCEPHDCKALADIMLQALECPDLRERGRLAAEFALSRYDISQVAENYMTVYESCLQKPGSPQPTGELEPQ